MFALGILCALGLIGYGRMLVPAMNDLSVAAAVLVLVIYAIITWVAPRRIEEKWPTILSAGAAFGILAGFIFVSEVLLEYVLLPAVTYQKVEALINGADFDPNEFMPLVHEALAEDLDAPGMELYDDYDANRPKS